MRFVHCIRKAPSPLPRHDLTGIDPFPIESSDVLRAIQSFPKGNGSGGSGLRAAHLLNMHGSDDASFILALTFVITIVGAEKAPSEFAPFFASAPLVPTLTKGGGIRPIAVGEVFRRIVFKVATLKVRVRAASVLSPIQLGVEVPNGVETIVHGLNRLVNSSHLSTSAVVAQVDFCNAFNQVHRPAFFAEVLRLFPEIAAYV
jgi:hypothetical protein